MPAFLAAWESPHFRFLSAFPSSRSTFTFLPPFTASRRAPYGFFPVRPLLPANCNPPTSSSDSSVNSISFHLPSMVCRNYEPILLAHRFEHRYEESSGQRAVHVRNRGEGSQLPGRSAKVGVGVHRFSHTSNGCALHLAELVGELAWVHRCNAVSDAVFLRATLFLARVLHGRIHRSRRSHPLFDNPRSGEEENLR